MNRFEKWFTIFAMIFLTGILRWASLYVSPDPEATSGNSYNPFDRLSSLIQHFIYSLTFLLLIARINTSVTNLQRSFIIWLLPIMALVSFLWSDFPDWTLRKGITTLQTTYFGLYFASRFSVKEQINILTISLAIVGILTVLFSFAFPGSAIEAGANAGALRGPFTQKNLLARIASLGIIVFFVAVNHFSKNKKILAFGLISFMIIVLLTTSKTALLLLFLLALLVPLYRVTRWNSTISIPIVIISFLLISSIFFVVLSNWESTMLALGRDPDLSGRTGLWLGAIEKIKERPWLGYGYQGFWQDGGGAMELWAKERYKPPHAHNGYINIALDLGLTGLIIFMSFIFIEFIKSISFLRRYHSAIAFWPILYITFFAFYNYSENTIIEHNSIFWVLLVSISLSMSSSGQVNRENSQAIVHNIDT